MLKRLTNRALLTMTPVPQMMTPVLQMTTLVPQTTDQAHQTTTPPPWTIPPPLTTPQVQQPPTKTMALSLISQG